jgi:hypothetical protein
MKIQIIAIPFSILMLVGCNSATVSDPYGVDSATENQDKKEAIIEEEVSFLDNVKDELEGKYAEWVLFENGTYIVYSNTDTIADVESHAINIMQEYGPVFAGGPPGDFNVAVCEKVPGWAVSGHYPDMFTYVHPNEMKSSSKEDMYIGLYGRSKRNEDGNLAKVIHVNHKED